MARTQLVHSLVNRFRLRHITERKIVFHRARIQLSRQARMRFQHFQLRAENQLAIRQYAIEERLDAKPVARQKQAAGVLII